MTRPQGADSLDPMSNSDNTAASRGKGKKKTLPKKNATKQKSNTGQYQSSPHQTVAENEAELTTTQKRQEKMQDAPEPPTFTQSQVIAILAANLLRPGLGATPLHETNAGWQGSDVPLLQAVRTARKLLEISTRPFDDIYAYQLFREHDLMNADDISKLFKALGWKNLTSPASVANLLHELLDEACKEIQAQNNKLKAFLKIRTGAPTSYKQIESDAKSAFETLLKRYNLINIFGTNDRAELDSLTNTFMLHILQVTESINGELIPGPKIETSFISKVCESMNYYTYVASRDIALDLNDDDLAAIILGLEPFCIRKIDSSIPINDFIADLGKIAKWLLSDERIRSFFQPGCSDDGTTPVEVIFDLNVIRNPATQKPSSEKIETSRTDSADVSQTDTQAQKEAMSYAEAIIKMIQPASLSLSRFLAISKIKGFTQTLPAKEAIYGLDRLLHYLETDPDKQADPLEIKNDLYYDICDSVKRLKSWLTGFPSPNLSQLIGIRKKHQEMKPYGMYFIYLEILINTCDLVLDGISRHIPEPETFNQLNQINQLNRLLDTCKNLTRSELENSKKHLPKHVEAYSAKGERLLESALEPKNPLGRIRPRLLFEYAASRELANDRLIRRKSDLNSKNISSVKLLL